MEWEQVLTELVKFIKTAAPQVWAIYRRQLIVVSVQYALWGAACAYGTYGLREKAREARVSFIESGKRSEDDAVALVWGLVAAMCAVVALGCISAIFGRVINPDYYIIQGMIEALK